MDWGYIIVGILSLIGTLAGSVLTGSKQTALILYRLDALEKKQDKHNGMIERTYALEKRVEGIEAHLEETQKDVNRLLNK